VCFDAIYLSAVEESDVDVVLEVAVQALDLVLRVRLNSHLTPSGMCPVSVDVCKLCTCFSVELGWGVAITTISAGDSG
jgi:hypothetical protein